MITKWTAEEIASDKGLIMDVENFNIRQCSHCGAYIRVEDQSGEHKFKDGHYENDICDDCVECIEQGKEIVVFEAEEYEDYLEDESEEEEADNIDED